MQLQKYFAWVDNAAPRMHGLLNESLSARHGILLYEILAKEAPEVPQITQASVLFAVYHK